MMTSNPSHTPPYPNNSLPSVAQYQHNYHDTRRPSSATHTANASLRPRKRTKTSSACEACQHRKSRCELVTNAGCHRCVTLGTPCSFRESSNSDPLEPTPDRGYSEGPGRTISAPTPVASSSSTSSVRNGRFYVPQMMAPPPPQHQALPPPASPPRTVQVFSEAGEETLAEIRERMMRMEAMIQTLATRDSNSGKPRSVPAMAARQDSNRDPAPFCPLELHARWSNFTKSGERGGWSAIISNLLGSSKTGFLDPVEMDIVTSSELQSGWRIFQTSFSKILPLPEVVDLDHPVPSGILYRNAFLYFISRFSAPNNLFNSAQIEALAELLEYNMTLISSEEANEDMIRSLLIISLSSARQDERFFKVEDQFGAGAKAYMLATSMGLDDKVEKLGNEPRESLSAEWNRPLLSSVCLWYSVLHRHLWSQLYTNATFRTSVEHPVHLVNVISPTGAMFLGDAWLFHLTLESQMMETMEPVITALKKLRGDRIYEPSHAQDMLEKLDLALKKFDGLNSDLQASQIPSTLCLVLDCTFLPALVLFKISSEQRTVVPWVIAPEDKLPPIMRVGNAFLNSLPHVLKRIAASRADLSQLPARILLLTFMPITIIAQLCSMRVNWWATHPISRTGPDAAIAKEMLKSAHPASRRMIQAIEALPAFDASEEELDGRRTGGVSADGGGQVTLPPGGVFDNFDLDSYFSFPWDFGDGTEFVDMGIIPGS